MGTTTKTQITVLAEIKAPLQTVWNCWSDPKHITQWCFASDDWHAPHAENDLRVSGKFKTTLAARDGSMQFDFEGVYTRVQPLSEIEYDIADGRKVSITFLETGGATEVKEIFEPESTNSLELQQGGWQSILDNFKAYVEKLV